MKTRSGEIKYIAKGSTVLDFAFKIHRDIGFAFKYAIVNDSKNKAPPYTKLYDGDKVKIVTDKDINGNLKNNAQLKWFAYVNTELAKRVLKNTKKLCKIATIKDNLRNDCCVAAILHDIGMEKGKHNHNKRSAMFADELLKNNQYVYNARQIISAVGKHSDCVYEENTILVILTLADKLDITHHRVGFAGAKINGMKQLLNILKISIRKYKKNIQFVFYVNNDFNMKEFMEFYFYNKLVCAVKNFCYHFNCEYKILFKRRR